MSVERAEDIAEAYDRNELEPVSLTKEHIERIRKVNTEINAFITILEQRALERASRCMREGMTGKNAMAGQPVAVKDIFYIKGVRCTVGSKILKDFVPDYTSTAVRKLERHGAIIVGTTNLHEFASGVTTVNPFFGATRNPWNKERIAGGSSGGSAAAVAAGLVPMALGTDTSGSIRIPAALCGVFGLKPSYGLVSKFGVFPLSKSLDHVGPIASSARGIAIMLDCLKGYDANDPSSKRFPNTSLTLSIERKIQTKRCLIPESLFKGPLQDEVKKGFDIFISRLQQLGIKTSYTEAEYFADVRSIWAPIRLGEALAYHYEWYKSRSSDYGEDVLNRLKAGESYTAVDYILAQEKKKQITDIADKELGEESIYATPTVSVPAPRIGEKSVELKGENYDVYQLLSSFTVPFNVTGQPAITIPAFLSRENLPIGMQIVAKTGNEHILVNIAAKYEEEFGINRHI
jgi:aspartyl-tRNA(Asn)/glutamyl-tRNA(Gln) amidotransferase subunit A